MSEKIDLRIIKTKKNLYEGLIKLMEDNKFEDIKVSDICSISLVNRSTFYDHYSDKYELLYDLMENLRKELSIKLEENIDTESPREYYLKGIKLFLEHINEHNNTYNSILKNNTEGTLLDIAYYTITKDVEKNINNTKYTKNIPSEIISRFYVSGIINVCIEYIKFKDKYSIEDIVSYIDKLLPKDIY